MQTKRVIALMIAAAVSAAVAAAVSLSGGGHRADPLVGTPVLPRVKADPSAVAKVILTHAKGVITFTRSDSGWTVAEKSNFPADPAKIRKMLLGLAEIVYVEPKTVRPDLFTRLNLEDPGKEKSQSILVEVDDDKGAALGKLIVGRRRIDELGGGNDGVYFRFDGQTQTWLAKGALDIDTDVVQWLDRRIADIPEARIKQATIQQADGAKIVIARDKPADKFALKDLPADRKLKSDSSLVEPATALQGFDLTDVKRSEDLAFPKEGLVVATYETFEGLSIRVELMKQGELSWIRLAASDGDDDKAKAEAESLNKRWSPWVYGIAAYKATALATKLDDLLEAPAPAGGAAPAGQSPRAPGIK